jgi:HlyD family secretion protein
MIRKLLLGAGAAGVLAMVILAALPKPLEVETATAFRGPFRLVVDEDGKTRVRERYTVSAPVAGTLARIDLHAGDPVEPGTVVARLKPLASPLLDPRAHATAEQRLASARDAHAQALASITRADAAAQLAKSNLERDRQLAKTNAVAPNELEQAEIESRIRASELESLRFAERVAAHAVDEAQWALASFSGKQGAGEQVDLTSPVHGRVLHVLHEDSGVVSAGQGLIELGDPGSLEIVVELLSQDAVMVRPGMSATLTHWGGARELKAHVQRVEPAAFTHLSALGVEEQRVNVLLDLDDPSAAPELGDGFALEAQILTWSGTDVLQIPTSALFRHGDGWAVFGISGGKAVLRDVVLGHRGPLHTEILSGLAAGEVIIAHPAPTLVAGIRVRASRA